MSADRKIKKNTRPLSKHIIDEYRIRSKYGFIYLIFSILINVLYYVNLVEYFKKAFVKICTLVKKEIDCKAANNWAIDFFIVVKYLFLIAVISMPFNSIFLKIVIYLLFMNVFTYFHHHVWKIPSDKCLHWQLRRFTSLLLAIVFNVLCYTYLFWNGFSNQILWSSVAPLSFDKVMLYSISNTFLLPSSLSLTNTFGIYLQTSQQLVSFIFLVIILSQSVPKPKE